MNHEDIIELRDRVDGLVTLLRPVEFCVRADTGGLVYVHSNGDKYRLEGIVRANPVKSQELQEKILEEIEYVQDMLQKYIHEYGDLPPELYTH